MQTVAQELEQTQPALAEHLRQIANGTHAIVKVVWIGKLSCSEARFKGAKLAILCKDNTLVLVGNDGKRHKHH